MNTQNTTAFEYVVALDHHGTGYEAYTADVLAYSVYGGEPARLDHVEVTLAPETAAEKRLALFEAAMLAERTLAEHGWVVVDPITSYGSHGKGLVCRGESR